MARGRRAGRGPDYEWHAFAGLGTAVDLTVTTASLGSTSFAIASPGGTIVRLRGRVFAQLDAGAVDERVVLAVGIGVASTPAVAAGIGSLPTPHSEASYPWMWHQYLVLSSLAGGTSQDAEFMSAVIDGKAMRKVKADQSLFIAIEVASVVDAAGTFDWMYGIRFLDAT